MSSAWGDGYDAGSHAYGGGSYFEARQGCPFWPGTPEYGQWQRGFDAAVEPSPAAQAAQGHRDRQDSATRAAEGYQP